MPLSTTDSNGVDYRSDAEGTQTMPKANPLPRKYIATIDEAQYDLQEIAKLARKMLNLITQSLRQDRQIDVILRDIEARAYKLAYELSEIEISNDCSSCPVAPPITKPMAHLLVLADELEMQAALARECAISSTKTNTKPGYD